MSITVKAAMAIGAWPKCQILAGHGGLSNAITSVDSMEVPDIKPWLRQGVMLVTTGYPLRESPEQITELIKNLFLAKAAALAIKTRFTGPIPQDAIDTANALDIPLIVIPDHIPHIELENPIIQCIGDNQRKNIIFSLEMHNRFIDLELNGGGFNDIATTLSSLIDAPVAILDGYGRIIAEVLDTFPAALRQAAIFSPDAHFLAAELLPDVRTLIKQTQVVLSGYTISITVRAALVKNRICGYISAFDIRHSFDETALIAIDHAAKSVSLEFLRTEATREQAEQMDTSLFMDIIGRTFDEKSIHWAKAMHWPALPFVVSIFDIKDFHSLTLSHTEEALQQIKQEMRMIISSELSRHYLTYKSFTISDSLIFLIFLSNMEKASILPLLKRIQDSLLQRDFATSLAISGVGKSLTDISTCYHDAFDALFICSCLQENISFAMIEDYRLEQMIMRTYKSEQFEALYNSLFAEVCKYDGENHTELMKTLRIFCTCLGSKTKTAQKLFLHRNTLQYRISKLESIMGISLGDDRNILNIAFLLTIKAFSTSAYR